MRQRLPQATRITLVGEREGDVYEALTGSGPGPAGHAQLASRSEQGRHQVDVARTAAMAPHSARAATLAVRFIPVALLAGES